MRLYDFAIPADGITGDELIHYARFEQMYLAKLTAEGDELPKRIAVLRIRNTRKVDL